MGNVADDEVQPRQNAMLLYPHIQDGTISHGKAAGAVWVRIMNDYGHIDDMTPSFAISLYKEYRGFGIGTALMKAMVRLLKRQGYTRGSLAVRKNLYDSYWKSIEKCGSSG